MVKADLFRLPFLEGLVRHFRMYPDISLTFVRMAGRKRDEFVHMTDRPYRIQMSQSRLHLWHGGSLVTPEPLSSVAFLAAYRVRAFAALLSMTPRRLHQCFVRDLGLTPKEWMRGERMVRARYLLREGRMVKDVAERLGFTTSRDFAREFYWFYDVSPTEFQRAEWKRSRWQVD